MASSPELAVLHDILFEPSLLSDIAARVPPEAFGDSSARECYQVLLDLGPQKAGDAALVESRVRDPAIVASAIASPAISSLWEEHVEALLRDWAVRRMKNLGATLMKITPDTLDVVLDDLHRASRDLVPLAPRPRHAGDVAREVLSALDTPRGDAIPYPFVALQDATGGQWPGNVIVLKGPTGGGKSVFAAQCAVEAAKHGPALLCSNEMLAEEYVRRIIARKARVPALRIKTGSVGEGEVAKIVSAGAELHGMNLWIMDQVTTVRGMRAAMEYVRREAGSLAWVALDWLQNLEAKGESRTAELDEAMRQIGAMADEFRVPVMVVVQIDKLATRLGQGGIGTARGSVFVELVADQVIELIKDEKSADKNRYRLRLIKAREGMLTETGLALHGAYAEFQELADA